MSAFGFLVFGRHRAKTSAGVLPFMPRPCWGSLRIVRDQVGVEVGLHLLDALVELGPAQDTEVLVEGPVQAFDEAVGPGSTDLTCSP